MSAFILRHARPLLLALVLLLGGALFLLDSAIDYDAGRYFESVALLRQVKQLDAQWEVDVLKARIGMNHNYDALVDPLPELGALSERVGATVSTLARQMPAADAAALSASVAAFQDALQRKGALIESFKSHNAVMHNSHAFLPIAARDLATGRAPLPAPLEAAVYRALLDVLLYQHGGAGEAAQPVLAQLDALAARRGTLPAAQQEGLDVFVAHARAVVREKSAVYGLLNEIAAVPAARSIDDIAALLAALEQRQSAGMGQESMYMAALSAALALLLGYVIVLLMRSHAVIGRVNRQLQLANEHLEQRVQQRTAELSGANLRLREEIAERKLLQSRLLQSEKLASVGQLAAGMAHEINNPLAYLSSNFSMLETYVGQLFQLLDAQGAGDAARPRQLGAAIDADFLREDIPLLLSESRGGMERVARIVQNLKDFARAGCEQHWEWADLHQGVENTLSLLAPRLQPVADVVREYGALPAVQCLPRQINQVVMNLVLNAAQAMGEARGRITVRSGCADGQVWLEVADDGCGIEPGVLTRVFDPFFTTRPIGEGAGLGLSLAYGIVQDHHGQIEVQSAPGQGACFRLLLPVRQPGVEAVAEEEGAAAPA